MKVSVISPCFNRFKHYEDVLESWLIQDEVDDVIVCDNSGSFKTNLPVRVVSISENLGPVVKYPLAFWAKNDLVIFADDDILVKEGLVKDFLKYWRKNTAVGIYGRQLAHKNYYDSPAFWGKDIDEPVKVQYLGGGCAMVEMKWCAVPMKGAPPIALDDLWWNALMKNRVNFYVIPTEKYEFMKEYLGSGLHTNPETKRLREEKCREWGFIHET